VTPYLLIGLVAATVVFVATPLVEWFAKKVGAIDHPSDRKVHANPTPTLGGLAILLGLLGAGFGASLMPEFEDVFTQSSQWVGIAAGGIVIFMLGVVDDLRDLPAPVKLAGQVFAAGLLFLSGVKMQFLVVPGVASFSLGDDVSVLVTVLWIVAMINAVNLVDGLDGLAAGVVAIAASSFFVFAYELTGRVVILNSAYPAPLIAIAIVGVCLGFLRHNFYPARIFMGDSGSMLLGLVLGATTVSGIGSSNVVSSGPAEAFLAWFPLLIPVLVAALPILDAVFAVVRRVRRRRSVFHADKEHLHHRLMDLGHGHRQAVIVMYAWSALAAGAALAFTFWGNRLVFALPIAVAAIVVYTLFPLLTKVIQDKLSL
jgi:UDP-GlcNAc:undecaprenyl-phosphate/decaprenyl-phosphate GlcNAc-1-phosphate transferase